MRKANLVFGLLSYWLLCHVSSVLSVSVNIHFKLDAGGLSLARGFDSLLHSSYPNDLLYLNSTHEPHLTLFLANFSDTNLLTTRLNSLSSQFIPCPVNIYSATLNGTYAFLMVQNNPCLQYMSDFVVNNTYDLVYKPPVNMSTLTTNSQYYQAVYGYGNIFLNFNPHITILYDKTDSLSTFNSVVSSLTPSYSFTATQVIASLSGIAGSVLSGTDFSTNTVTSPSTASPTTPTPSTATPTTDTPSTATPSTATPSTATATTATPTTVTPTSGFPPTTATPSTVSPTTLAPTTSVPTTTLVPTLPTLSISFTLRFLLPLPNVNNTASVNNFVSTASSLISTSIQALSSITTITYVRSITFPLTSAYKYWLEYLVFSATVPLMYLPTLPTGYYNATTNKTSVVVDNRIQTILTPLVTALLNTGNSSSAPFKTILHFAGASVNDTLLTLIDTTKVSSNGLLSTYFIASGDIAPTNTSYDKNAPPALPAATASPTDDPQKIPAVVSSTVIGCVLAVGLFILIAYLYIQKKKKEQEEDDARLLKEKKEEKSHI